MSSLGRGSARLVPRRGVDFLVVVAYQCASFCDVSNRAAFRGRDRPNVILIVLDTVRADALSSSGNLLADTPYLDRLAAEGVRFSRATSASTWTPPGHASLFTGLYPFSHGTRGLEYQC